MIKQISQIAAILFYSFITINTSAQDSADFLERLSEKFQTYCRIFPWEEIFVHTDREEYISGEKLWFNIYLIDRQSNKPSSSSSIAYFEILNSENRPVIQKRIRLENGSGPGDALLPDTLSSGSFIIRVYTNRMKNFLPSNCFMKKITIYNALSPGRFKGILNQESIPLNLSAESKASEIPGFNLRVNKSGSENLEIIIEADRNFRSLYGSICYLFIQTHGIINYKSNIDLLDDITRKSLPADLLIPGINQLVIFNQAGRKIAEKFIWSPSKESVNVSVDSPENIKRREKITLEIDLDDETDSLLNSPHLSISIAELTGKLSQNINDYMIFGSEFGILPDEIRYSKPDEIPPAKIEKFLSTLKSDWIDFNSILSGNNPELKYNRESLYHYLNGRLIKKDSPGSLEDNFLFLSMPGKKATFQYAKADKNGNFNFSLPVNEQLKNLIIQPEVTGKDISIKLESPYSEVYPEFVSVAGTLDEEYIKQISRQGANYQVQKIYGIGQEVEKTDKPVFSSGTRRFYGKPDIELIMDDYIKLPVMQEVFFELMPGVFLKKRKSVYEITVADPVDKRIFEKPPVLFIDGVVINDASIIANLDPETVEEIDVIKERYLVGDYLFYGLLNVITRAGDFRGIDLPDYAVRLPYRVTDPVISFSSPDYSDPKIKKGRLPDLRNTLYWNPAVETDAGGKARVEFWASDFITDYIINIQGLTSHGQPLAVKKRIRVE